MTSSDRFARVAALPSPDGWTAHLAVDRSGGARAVVVSAVPAAVADDAARLAALVRDVEAAARLHHENVVPVIGLESAADGLEVVETHRPGGSVRALLEAGGRLPADVAARIVVDACAGVSHAHARDTGEGHGLAHGTLAPERIVVGADGVAAVNGFGRAGDAAAPTADVAALAAILYECLAGEAPPPAPRPLALDGVPAPLAAVLRRALRGEGFPAAAALGDAIAGTGELAARDMVAAYLEAIVPADEGARGEAATALAAALADGAAPRSEPSHVDVSDDLILGEPTPIAIPAPEPSGVEISDANIVGEITPKPEPRARAAQVARVVRPAPVVVAAAEPKPVVIPAVAEPKAVVIPAVEPTPIATPAVDPAPVAAAAPSLSDAQIMPIPTPRTAPGGLWWGVTAALCLAIGAAGFAAGLMVERSQRGAERAEVRADVVPAPEKPSPSPRPSATPSPSAERPSAEKPTASAAAEKPEAPVAKPIADNRAAAKRVADKRGATRPSSRVADARPAATPARYAPRDGARDIGWLDVFAPDDADISVDGKRIGRGEVHRFQLPEGTHRVDVRLGDAKTGETFTVGARETYTYRVHQTN